MTLSHRYVGFLSSSQFVGAVGFALGLAVATAFGHFNKSKKKSIASSTKDSSERSYKPGQRPTLPSSTFGKHVEVFDPSELKSSYSLMISSATPRPIAFVSSRSKTTGVDNVSPFSYFGLMSHNPPMVTVGFCRKGAARSMKDSITNIMETKEFALNIISEWFLDAANHCCGDFKPDVDEFAVSGLTKAACVEVSAPRVYEAAVTFECKVQEIYPVTDDEGKATTEIVLAKVVRVHVDRDVLVKDFDPTKPELDTAKLKPLGRLGGNVYCTLGDFIDIPRPKV